MNVAGSLPLVLCLWAGVATADTDSSTVVVVVGFVAFIVLGFVAVFMFYFRAQQQQERFLHTMTAVAQQQAAPAQAQAQANRAMMAGTPNMQIHGMTMIDMQNRGPRTYVVTENAGEPPYPMPFDSSDPAPPQYHGVVQDSKPGGGGGGSVGVMDAKPGGAGGGGAGDDELPTHSQVVRL